MGKRARKTRWRALDIADDHSDSEESNTNSSAVSSRYSHSNGYYSKYSYSSQSTPARRRYNQYDGSTKSTRSSSTTSENKITFNEDEYTRITTPRQDVLFKKGYLNKPKSYHTQTSTGNSTISTGNSTENGTPDHQSADLDYESQFVFPNGFLDQNGIYYVNSYEPYPLMLFNPPTYYHECSNSKSKRYSTGSLSESMSPNNEEVTSQDLSQSGGEASNSGVSDYSGGPPVYNMVYPGYYVNGACTPTDTANCHHYPPEPVKKLKKRRERKSSKTIPGDSSEYTDENSGDELPESSTLQSTSIAEHQQQEVASRVNEAPRANVNETPAEPQQNDVENAVVNCINNETIKTASENSTNDDGCADKKTEPNLDPSAKPSVLKPDAEEFVPRVYHPLGPPPHIKMIPPNFMPIPLVPIGEFGGQNFAPHPAFIPPGIPINFIPHPLGQKIFPTAPGFVSYPPPIVHEAKIEETSDQNEVNNFSEEKERENIATPSHTPVLEESKAQAHSKAIDIATVVSKLEAVKQQERQDPEVVEADNPKPAVNESKPFRGTPRLAKPQNFKRNYYNKYRNSPVRSGEASPQIQNGGSSPRLQDSPHHFRQSPVRHVDVIQHPQISNEADARMHYHNSPVRHVQVSQPIKNVEVIQKPFEKTSLANGVHAPISDFSKQVRNSPERYHKKSWKPNGYQNNYGSPKRYQSNQTYQKPATNGYEKPYTNGYANSNKNYSESLRNGHQLVETHISNNTPVKIVGPSEEQLKPKSNSQWISVSSRKKKKNKNVEDLDADTIDLLNDCTDNTSDLFESYDVSQLVDVVPPSQLENHIPQATEKRIEDILTSIAQSEVPEVLAIAQMTPININIPEVSDIEKNIIVKIEEENQPPVDRSEEKLNESLQAEEKTVHLDVTKDRELTPSELNESVEGEEEEGFKPKKRSKKGTQKPLTKKVIITDIFNDLSVTPNDAKTPLKKIVKKIEEVKPVITEPQIPMATADPEPQLKAKESTPELEPEQLEKKSKKKKKNKAAKPICDGNNPVPDESCDILLENNLAVETLEKTNDEISLELDKLIQKGMYSSLQEKMKSINVEPAVDDFFKTIGAVVTPAKDKPTSTFKAPDFNRIFQSTRQFLKPNMVSVEHANTDIKVDVDDFDDRDTKACSSTADAANSSAGLVLDNAPEVQKALVDPEPPAEEEIQDVEADKKLYPITQAVKEWMSKTRETTPEVEILKSPSAIQKEFGTTPGQDPNDLLDSDPEDEEITLFSSEETLIQDQPDLLEYWENDLPVVSKDCDLSKDIVCADGKSCDKCRNGSIKQDEEEIEVYESKYGQNEAFLHLQKEIVEKQKNAPRTGHLPYRAVCCSLQ